MNWKRLAKLAVLIHDNHDDDYETVKVNGKVLLFDMRSYFNFEDNEYVKIHDAMSCATSCCAAGYAMMYWGDEIPNDTTLGYCGWRIVLGVYDDFILSKEIFDALFDSNYTNNVSDFVKRVHDFMDGRQEVLLPSGPDMITRLRTYSENEH